MADETGISWTDHTHNEWWGCSAPAGAGCDNCYAAQLDRRTGGQHFGIGTAPRLTKEQNRNKPYRWNREAEAAGIRAKVFCGSMMISSTRTRLRVRVSLCGRKSRLPPLWIGNC